MRVLVVEDEPELGQAIVETLRDDEGHAVDWARDGGEADELVFVNAYDLVLLDWTIPPPSGLELLRRWRAADRTMPVLMLTARDDIHDRVRGLDSGADDYLGKPFSFDELLARVRSLLRRKERHLVLELAAGDVVFDRNERVAKRGVAVLDLSPKEAGILEYLLIHKDRVVSRSELSEHVWDDSFDAMSNVIDVMIYRLRRKIDSGGDGRLLHTVKGRGYVLKSERG